jgi:hypothetical protein
MRRGTYLQFLSKFQCFARAIACLIILFGSRSYGLDLYYSENYFDPELKDESQWTKLPEIVDNLVHSINLGKIKQGTLNTGSLKIKLRNDSGSSESLTFFPLPAELKWEQTPPTLLSPGQEVILQLIPVIASQGKRAGEVKVQSSKENLPETMRILFEVEK